MENVELKVHGMTCAHCVRAVSDALADVDGVVVETVEIGSARLRLDPSKASIGVLVDALMDAGYEAEEAPG